MGLSASLFFSTAEDTETLFSRISLTSEQIADGRSHKDTLLELIKPELSDALGVPVRHWLQGSYKNHTVIRPTRKGEEFDIDVGIYALCDAESEGLEAKETRELLRNVLEWFISNRPEAELEDSKNSCERLRYPAIFHIDIPFYYYDAATDTCKLATGDSGWVNSDPKALQEWFNDKTSALSSPALAQLRRVLKYLKAWTALTAKDDSVIIPSVALTVLTAKSFTSFGHDDDAFVHTATAVCDHILSNDTVQNPCSEGDLLNLDHRDLETLRSRVSLLKRVCEFVAGSSDSVEQFVLWSTTFEHLFPPYGERAKDLADKTGLPAVTTPPRIRVRHLDKNGNTLSNQVQTSITVHRGESLSFSIENVTDYPHNVTVKWFVRNRGLEANRINDLGHTQNAAIHDESPESCEYNGTHYKECLIVDNRSIKGLSTVKVVIRGFPRPKRNPPRKKYFKGS